MHESRAPPSSSSRPVYRSGIGSSTGDVPLPIEGSIDQGVAEFASALPNEHVAGLAERLSAVYIPDAFGMNLAGRKV